MNYNDLWKCEIERDELLLVTEITTEFECLDEFVWSDKSSLIIFELFVVFCE